jgi:hypothetical protein
MKENKIDEAYSINEEDKNVCNSLFRKPESQGIYQGINGNWRIKSNSISKKCIVNMSRTRTYDCKTILAAVLFVYLKFMTQ